MKLKKVQANPTKKVIALKKKELDTLESTDADDFASKTAKLLGGATDDLTMAE